VLHLSLVALKKRRIIVTTTATTTATTMTTTTGLSLSGSSPYTSADKKK